MNTQPKTDSWMLAAIPDNKGIIYRAPDCVCVFVLHGGRFWRRCSEHQDGELREDAIESAINVLNEALAADPKAINALMRLEVPVNPRLAAHSTIQVGFSELDPDSSEYVVRPLGLINGLFGVDGDSWGYIAAEIDENGLIRGFCWTPTRS